MISYINILLFIFSGVTISLISNQLLLKFSQNLGIRNKNNVTIRWSNQSKPSLGGIGLFLGFLSSLFLNQIIEPDFNLFGDLSFLGLFFAASMAFFMGLADDAYDGLAVTMVGAEVTPGSARDWIAFQVHAPLLFAMEFGTWN